MTGDVPTVTWKNYPGVIGRGMDDGLAGTHPGEGALLYTDPAKLSAWRRGWFRGVLAARRRQLDLGTDER